MTTEAIVKRRYLQSSASRSTDNTTITQYNDTRHVGGNIGDGNAAPAVSYSTAVDRLYADIHDICRAPAGALQISTMATTLGYQRCQVRMPASRRTTCSGCQTSQTPMTRPGWRQL